MSAYLLTLEGESVYCMDCKHWNQMAVPPESRHLAWGKCDAIGIMDSQGGVLTRIDGFETSSLLTQPNFSCASFEAHNL